MSLPPGHPALEMVTVHVCGEAYEVPKMLTDELARLRAFERELQDYRRDRLMAEYVREHGPLPEPPPSPWVLVER